MVKSLLIMLSKDPYSFEEPNLALDLVSNLKEDNVDVNIFLIEDGVFIARKGQKPTDGVNIGEKLKKLIDRGVKVLVEDISLRARGLSPLKIMENVRISNLDELVELLMERVDRVVWF